MTQVKPVQSPTLTSQGDEKRTARTEAALKLVPVKFQTLFQKATQGLCSPRSAIKAKCQECVGYEELSPRVGGCTSYACPLWAYRPYQGE